MRTKTMTAFALIAVCTVVTAGSTALAQPGWFARHGGRQTPLKRLLMGELGRNFTLRSELDITAEQRSQIHRVLQQRRGLLKPTVTKIVAAKRALRDAVLAEEADEKKVRKAASRLGDVIGEVALHVAAIVRDVRPILTEEQLTLIEDHAAERDIAVDEWIETPLPAE